VTSSGLTLYPYQGGCNEWEFLYKDASGNVYSYGQNVSNPMNPSPYPQAELIVRGSLAAGMTWKNNLGFVTESVTVESPVTVTINGTAFTGYPVQYVDEYNPPSTGTIVYVAGYGPVQVTNWCVSPAVQENLTAAGIAAGSI
jgi:hypothetical protein